MFPSHLTKQLKVGSVVLILGAGATRESKIQNNKRVLLADELAALFAQEAGYEHEGEDLPEVMQAVCSPIGPIGEEQKLRILKREFLNIKPSETLTRLFEFPWRKAYTFNIDDSIERIIRKAGQQRIEIFNALCDRRVDPFTFHILQVIHLNGSIQQPSAGFIFSLEEY